MLRELSIKNFAIIDDLKIRFSEGMTIFSGETGAGKSIIINAVNLLLGGRASTGIIRTGTDTAELEALFDIKHNSRVYTRLEELGYRAMEGLLIRRVISKKKKHRIYINGHLATMQILNGITENLASISGQHAHQGLLKEEQQLLMLDRYADLLPLRGKVRRLVHQMVPLMETLDDLQQGKIRTKEQKELLSFQKKEILAADITPGEDHDLEQEKLRLQNSQLLYKSVHDSLEGLYDARGAVVDQMSEVRSHLEKASAIDSQLAPVKSQMDQISFQIEDAVEHLRDYLNGIQMDENRLESVEERLDMLQRLKRKYGGSLEDVLSHLETIEESLSLLSNTSERIEKIRTELTELQAPLGKNAELLSTKRRTAASRLSKTVVAELASLKMSPTKFQVSLRNEPPEKDDTAYLSAKGIKVTETGMDQATFLIAPNPGEPLKPLADIASGGELSRVVLSLKAILAGTDAVETIVFDEVDAGIGGGVAEVVGKKLSRLAKDHQVICITHLPQIAKFGNLHFTVSKEVISGRTRTTIRQIGSQDRVKEIARMLGGETITSLTMDHARELLELDDS